MWSGTSSEFTADASSLSIETMPMSQDDMMHNTVNTDYPNIFSDVGGKVNPAHGKLLGDNGGYGKVFGDLFDSKFDASDGEMIGPSSSNKYLQDAGYSPYLSSDAKERNFALGQIIIHITGKQEHCKPNSYASRIKTFNNKKKECKNRAIFTHLSDKHTIKDKDDSIIALPISSEDRFRPGQHHAANFSVAAKGPTEVVTEDFNNVRSLLNRLNQYNLWESHVRHHRPYNIAVGDVDAGVAGEFLYTVPILDGNDIVHIPFVDLTESEAYGLAAAVRASGINNKLGFAVDRCLSKVFRIGRIFEGFRSGDFKWSVHVDAFTINAH